MLKFLLHRKKFDLRNLNSARDEGKDYLQTCLRRKKFDLSLISENAMDALVNLAMRNVENEKENVYLYDFMAELERISDVIRCLKKGFYAESDVRKTLLIFQIELYRERKKRS